MALPNMKRHQMKLDKFIVKKPKAWIIYSLDRQLGRLTIGLRYRPFAPPSSGKTGPCLGQAAADAQ